MFPTFAHVPNPLYNASGECKPIPAGEDFVEAYPLAEQKLVYRVLHGMLTQYPDLLDAQFLHDLQTRLQGQARAEGIDVTDHGAWDTWLGNEPVSCESRVERRFSVN